MSPLRLGVLLSLVGVAGGYRLPDTTFVPFEVYSRPGCQGERVMDWRTGEGVYPLGGDYLPRGALDLNCLTGTSLGQSSLRLFPNTCNDDGVALITSFNYNTTNCTGRVKTVSLYAGQCTDTWYGSVRIPTSVVTAADLCVAFSWMLKYSASIKFAGKYEDKKCRGLPQPIEFETTDSKCVSLQCKSCCPLMDPDTCVASTPVTYRTALVACHEPTETPFIAYLDYTDPLCVHPLLSTDNLSISWTPIQTQCAATQTLNPLKYSVKFIAETGLKSAFCNFIKIGVRLNESNFVSHDRLLEMVYTQFDAASVALPCVSFLCLAMSVLLLL